jgi:hypothetical protein
MGAEAEQVYWHVLDLGLTAVSVRDRSLRKRIAPVREIPLFERTLDRLGEPTPNQPLGTCPLSYPAARTHAREASFGRFRHGRSREASDAREQVRQGGVCPQERATVACAITIDQLFSLGIGISASSVRPDRYGCNTIQRR